jgi:cytochrome P450
MFDFDEQATTRAAIPRAPRLATLHAVAAGLNPEGYLRRRLERDGDPFRVRFPGLGDTLFTGSPAGAQEIFQASTELLTPPRPNPIEPLLGAGSLILLGGDRHRRERKLMMPPFHGERMRAYAQIIQEASLREVEQWIPGRIVRIQRAAQAITLQVIIGAIFGISDRERRAEYARVIGALLDAYTPPLLLIPALRRSFAGLGPWARFVELRARFDRLLSEEIARRRRRPVGGDDILSLLLATRYEDGSALSQDDLLDELRTLLVAGHETTATALAWAVFHVHRDLRVRDRLIEELGAQDGAMTPEQMTQLPYLGAVCQETLRLHPVVPIVLRQLTGPFELRGVEVRRGEIVGVAVSLLHKHPDIWPEPDQFRPERFLDRKYTPFEYAPFGGGHRRCVGAAFAAYEMRIVLGTLMARATLALDGRHRRVPPAAPKNITVGPRRELVLRCIARQ